MQEVSCEWEIHAATRYVVAEESSCRTRWVPLPLAHNALHASSYIHLYIESLHNTHNMYMLVLICVCIMTLSNHIFLLICMSTYMCTCNLYSALVYVRVCV